MNDDALESVRAEVADLAAHHLGATLAAPVVDLGRPAVRLGPDLSDITIGRLGGEPRLPANVPWPSWGDKPLSFLAELDLAQLGRFQTGLPLPRQGNLSFFYEADEQQAWGFDPAHAMGWRVIYAEADEIRRSAVPDGATTFAGISLSGQQVFTLPGWEEPALAGIWEDYVPPAEYLEALAGPGWASSTDHRVGGWPSLVQGPIWDECQLASSGLYMGGLVDRESPEVRAALAETNEWVLLLQLDTDDAAGWMWGDVGMLYFTARVSDLRSGRFDRTWMVLQCG